MRTDRYLEEKIKKEELNDKVTAILVAAALAITPAAVVYKVEEDKMETMRSYYEALIQESNQKAYYEGFLDGLFGIDNKYYKYTDSKDEGLVNDDIIVKNTEKKLVYTKNNIKY